MSNSSWSEIHLRTGGGGGGEGGGVSRHKSFCKGAMIK